MRKSQAGSDGLLDARKAYPDVDYRYLFVDDSPTNDLDFSNVTTWPMQEHGR